MTTDPESTPRDGSTLRVGDEELIAEAREMVRYPVTHFHYADGARVMNALADRLASSLASEGEGWVLVPRELTEEMRRACWRQQYRFHGASGEEADMLAERKVSDEAQRLNDEEGYAALIAAAPAPPADLGGDTAALNTEEGEAFLARRDAARALPSDLLELSAKAAPGPYVLVGQAIYGHGVQTQDGQYVAELPANSNAIAAFSTPRSPEERQATAEFFVAACNFVRSLPANPQPTLSELSEEQIDE